MIDLNRDSVSEIRFDSGHGYHQSIYAFFNKRGHFFDYIDDKTFMRIKDMAHNFWLNNTDEYLVQLAWVYAYCYVLNIPLILPKKREQYESLDSTNA